MKTALLSLFALITLTFPAQAKNNDAATHIWIDGGYSASYIPVRTKQMCLILTRQAALINSAKGHCYDGEKFVQQIRCRKSSKRGEGPKCETSSTLD